MGEIKTYNYNFPPYAVGDDKVILRDQIAKITEEVNEIDEACSVLNTERVAIETIDVIVACETLLRMLPEGYTDAAKQMVYAKIAARGQWKEDTTGQAANAEMPHSRPPMFFYSKTTPPSWAK